MFLLTPDVFPWDLAIALGMAGSFAILAWSVLSMRLARRLRSRLLLGFLGVLGLLGFSTLLWGSFIEPRIITVTRAAVALPYPQPLRIAVLSDLHVGHYSSRSFIQRVVDRTNAERPDLVLLAGDYIQFHNSSLEDLEPLKDLQAPMGVFGILGNHEVGMYRLYHNGPFVKRDREQEMTGFLRSVNVTVLRNAQVTIPTSRGPLIIAGIDDLWTGHADLGAALTDIPSRTPVILITHNPDVIRETQSLRAHLIVAGHTHGGQIRLPFWGPVPRLPTHLGQEYDQGLFPVDPDTTLAITRGVGASGPRARLLAPPEILMLETRPSGS